MHGLHPTKINKKCDIFNENPWAIAHQNDEKCAIFEENAWSIAHQNDKKIRDF